MAIWLKVDIVTVSVSLIWWLKPLAFLEERPRLNGK